jgi:hypothetical protein
MFAGCHADGPGLDWKGMSKTPFESFASGVENLSESCCVCLEDCEERIRQEPWTSVLIAGAIGYLLNFLPVGRMVGAFVRALLYLVKPALIVLGVLKLVSCFSECKSQKES